MAKERTYSRYTCEAATLLARQIQLGRRQRKWTEHELADRTGDKLALLPSAVRKPRKPVDDEF